MQQSVLLCISTILDSGNHYTKMMELVDDYGNTVFETIKITLVSTTILCQNVYSTLCLWIVVQVCDDCMKTDHPEKCASLSNLTFPLLASRSPLEIVNAVVVPNAILVFNCALQWIRVRPNKGQQHKSVHQKALVANPDHAVVPVSRICNWCHFATPRAFVESLSSSHGGKTQTVGQHTRFPNFTRKIFKCALISRSARPLFLCLLIRLLL